MSNTYEEKDTTEKLETYEWDNIWWDYSNKDCEKHILVIGDSISVGYRHQIVTMSDNKWCVDGIATSKAIDNDFFKATIDNVMSQQDKYDFILFNNGLHGWHLSSEEYGKHYKEILKYIKYKNIPMAVVLSTPVREKDNLTKFDKRCDEVTKRNKEAVAASNELNIPIIDLYKVIIDKSELYSNDGVHLTEEGYILLAKNLYEQINQLTK